MFILITEVPKVIFREWDFNTSHVYINLPRPSLPVNPQDISIHLMFILISGAAFYVCIKLEISIHLMFILIGGWS